MISTYCVWSGRKDTLQRLEWDGPCRLLKLKQMGAQGIHMKGVLPWLVSWLVAPVQEIFVLPWLFLTGHYFISFVPVTHPAGWAGRAASPYLFIGVSDCSTASSPLAIKSARIYSSSGSQHALISHITTIKQGRRSSHLWLSLFLPLVHFLRYPGH
jgi:hypothetical protein